MPNAKNAYSVGRAPPRSVVELLASRQAIAAAARPHSEEIVLAPGVISSRVPHFGHTALLEWAATSAAGISALQCGHMRTLTAHLAVRMSAIIG